MMLWVERAFDKVVLYLNKFRCMFLMTVSINPFVQRPDPSDQSRSDGGSIPCDGYSNRLNVLHFCNCVTRSPVPSLTSHPSVCVSYYLTRL